MVKSLHFLLLTSANSPFGTPFLSVVRWSRSFLRRAPSSRAKHTPKQHVRVGYGSQYGCSELDGEVTVAHDLDLVAHPVRLNWAARHSHVQRPGSPWVREVHPCPTQMGEMSDLLRQVRSMLARSGLGPAPPRSRDPVYLRGRGHRCLICTSVRFTAPFVDVSISELCG